MVGQAAGGGDAQAPGWVRGVLAERTRAIHSELHGHPQLARLASPDLQHGEYERLLGAFHGFFAGLDARRAELEIDPGLGLAPAVERLEDDLSELGASSDPAVSGPDPFDWIQSEAQGLAALYVLHGSAFGALSMAQCVERALPGIPRQYLNGGVDRAAWAALVSALDRAVDRDPAALEAMANAAFETFQRYGNWITDRCANAASTA